MKEKEKRKGKILKEYLAKNDKKGKAWRTENKGQRQVTSSSREGDMFPVPCETSRKHSAVLAPVYYVIV